MQDQAIENVSKIVKSIAHPIRLKILCVLLSGEKSVSEIHQNFSTSYSNVSQHLQKLLHQGILVSDKRSNFIYYSIAHKHTNELVKVLKKLYCEADDQ
jgi:DNA-binding transcriptional ArsR family regulator